MSIILFALLGAKLGMGVSYWIVYGVGVAIWLICTVYKIVKELQE